MRHLNRSAIAVAAALLVAGAQAADAQETARAVAGGGISVNGWTGKIDANEAAQGQALNNAKLAPDANGMRVTTGPAVVVSVEDL